jgi:hypothetical protein
MSTKRVTMKELGGEIEGFAAAAIPKQRQAVVMGLTRSLPLMAELSPVDTGLYAQSWDLTVTEEKAVFGNYAPHAAVIEYGARPFTPPIGPLLAWAKRVLKDGSQPPNYSSNVWALAKYTQKKIAAEGMKPRAILQNAMPMIMQNIRDELKRRN